MVRVTPTVEKGCKGCLNQPWYRPDHAYFDPKVKHGFVSIQNSKAAWVNKLIIVKLIKLPICQKVIIKWFLEGNFILC